MTSGGEGKGRVRLYYSDGSVQDRSLIVCDNILTRMVGMLKERQPDTPDVYQIVPCSGIHTFFMAFPIDVVFTDRLGNVLSCRTVSPYRMFSSSGAHMVFEGLGLLTGQLVLERVQVE